MSFDHKAIETLIAKDHIRDLALLYSRGVDRKEETAPATMRGRAG
jgi:hypothetical protein